MMLAYPDSLVQIGGAHSGVAPCNLLDVQDVNGNIYYWSDRAGLFPAAITADGNPAIVRYKPWINDVGEFRFFRSLQSDTGSVVLQNVSGDSLSREFDVLKTKSALEGAFAIYRCWQADVEGGWLEFHGTVTVENITESESTLKLTQLLDAANSDSAGATLSETCTLEWGSKMCGATGAQECLYSFATCQVVERFRGVLNSYEKNFGETAANGATALINRRRKI
jgi:hypothetical protein